MGEMKPLGSEKLNGNDKMKRILELTYYNNQSDNTSKPRNAEFISESTTGVYGIVKEYDGYYVKKGLNESSLDYIGGLFMKNKNRFSSYGEAYKKLEFLKGQENLQEDTRYVLKKPASSVPPPEPSAPAPDMGGTPPPPPPAPMDSPDSGMPPADPNAELGGEPTNGEDLGGEDIGDDSDYLKVIQKLTGRLGQKLDVFKDKLEKDDINYVINSVLAALDLNKLGEDDKDKIIEKFEEPEEGMDTEGDPNSELPVPTADEAEPNELGEEDDDPMDTLENLINTDFEEEEDVFGRLGNILRPEKVDNASKSCDLCGFKHGHAKGCPNQEEASHEFSTDVTDMDEDFDELSDDPFGEDHIHNDDHVFDKEIGFDDSDLDDDGFGDEENSKELDIDELTNAINQTVREKLGKYFE